MTDYSLIQELISFIQANNGIANKSFLINKVQKEFNLIRDRSVYYCSEFAIRFSQAKSDKLGNTILSLSTLKNYDEKPVFLCIVTPEKNYLLLINTTFLSKISHSSQSLRINNIKGSFNGSDIMRKVENIENIPENFQALFAIHKCFSFEENLERLVEKTNNIVPIGKRFCLDSNNIQYLNTAVNRTIHFLQSECYNDLYQDLTNRVKSVQNEIAIAAFIDNVNIRGRIIEYLITSNGNDLKNELIDCLHHKKALPRITVKDGLGDYSKNYAVYHTETDIKTKVMFLNGNPKAYNIDKLLSFLATDKSIYMVYLIGITEKKQIITKLVSVFDKTLISNTMIMKHWAGRNSRGVSQFLEKGLLEILNPSYRISVDPMKAQSFLNRLINM